MKVNFYLMKSKKSLLVLPSKKATKWVKLMKHGYFEEKVCYYIPWTLGEHYLDNNRYFSLDNFFTSVDLM